MDTPNAIKKPIITEATTMPPQQQQLARPGSGDRGVDGGNNAPTQVNQKLKDNVFVERSLYSDGIIDRPVNVRNLLPHQGSTLPLCQLVKVH